MSEFLTNHTAVSNVLKQNPDEMTEEYLRGFFYDWFCDDKSLPSKSKKLLRKLKAISPSRRFDPDKTYVFFKNNCPGNGSLYDDLRICDLETGDVQFCVTPYSGHESTRGESEVWGKDSSGEFKELVSGSWSDVKAFFKMTQEEWERHESNIPKSPFQVGVEVVLHGEYVPWGELPKKHVITKVSETKTFCLDDNEYRWFKKDGTRLEKWGRGRNSKAKTYRVELWSDYCARQKKEDERKLRQSQCEQMRRDIETAMYRIDRNGSEESYRQMSIILDFVNKVVPAPMLRKAV